MPLHSCAPLWLLHCLRLTQSRLLWNLKSTAMRSLPSSALLVSVMHVRQLSLTTASMAAGRGGPCGGSQPRRQQLPCHEHALSDAAQQLRRTSLLCALPASARRLTAWHSVEANLCRPQTAPQVESGGGAVPWGQVNDQHDGTQDRLTLTRVRHHRHRVLQHGPPQPPQAARPPCP